MIIYLDGGVELPQKKIGNLAKFLLGFSCRNNQIIL